MEEALGQVLSVIGVDTVEETVAIANDTLYCLADAVWASNLSHAHLMGEALRPGVDQ